MQKVKTGGLKKVNKPGKLWKTTTAIPQVVIGWRWLLEVAPRTIFLRILSCDLFIVFHNYSLAWDTLPSPIEIKMLQLFSFNYSENFEFLKILEFWKLLNLHEVCKQGQWKKKLIIPTTRRTTTTRLTSSWPSSGRQKATQNRNLCKVHHTTRTVLVLQCEGGKWANADASKGPPPPPPIEWRHCLRHVGSGLWREDLDGPGGLGPGRLVSPGRPGGRGGLPIGQILSQPPGSSRVQQVSNH